jgi:hypothetical protein
VVILGIYSVISEHMVIEQVLIYRKMDGDTPSVLELSIQFVKLILQRRGAMVSVPGS